MGWRFHGHAHVDPSHPVSFAVCDNCGFWWNITDLSWQRQWAGLVLQNQRILACPKCIDQPQPQLKTRIIPPDPTPTLNARPENFLVDDFNYQVTDDGSILITQDDVPTVTQNEANNRDEAE